MIAYLFFFHIVHWSFILGQGWLLSNHFCKACQNCLCCESSRKCHHAAQTTPTWTKTILTCFTKLSSEQPSLTQYERPMYNMKEKWICYYLLITISWFFFSILRDLGLNLGFLFFTHTYCIRCRPRSYGGDRGEVYLAKLPSGFCEKFIVMT